MLNHIRRDLAVLSGFVVLGLFLAATQARAQVQDQKKQDPRTVPLPPVCSSDRKKRIASGMRMKMTTAPPATKRIGVANLSWGVPDNC